MQQVFTYFEPDLALRHKHWDDLLRVWQSAWKANGWEPVIVGRSTATQSPLFPELASAAERFPTVNPKQYEKNCFERWAAAHAVGGGLWVDSDVIPRVFPSPIVLPAQYKTFDRGCATCAVAGDREAFEKLIRVFLDYVPRDDDSYNGRPHVSDMTILHRFYHDCAGECVAFGEEGWKDSKMVHFSSECVHKTMGAPMGKAHCIGEFFPNYAAR